ncbi:benzaldehyde dehydrogenase [Sphingobium sp. CECT 9361]|uniref:benzaldehyde dehydrogenase n=1 Tax=Sphingobium sp. CECT 9361 TaxID=2845384 RepID=UPI001E2854FA|nr:benzaldehyde dehydrogenase [Sphingobium sp. CECT 9361]CAH0354278.1 Benzaldehyde dehydrogenase [NAD(+)] [Sphingobium sp. CECT 9361]
MQDALELPLNGPWIAAPGNGTDMVNPASGAVLLSVNFGDAKDIRDAARRARKAQISWFSLPFDARATVLRKAADLMESNADFYIGWLMRETGSAGGKAGFEVSIVVKALREAAAMPSQPAGLVLPSDHGRLSFCRRMPLGVIGVISPFNFPMYLGLRAVAPALAVGNAVVLKPDPRTTISGGLLMQQLFTAAGLPEDVLTVVPGGGEAGEALCIDPNIAMIQFTGSTAVGRKIGALAGGHLKKLSLELGGKNSLIILDDADLDIAASNIAWGSYLHQGQICMASGRILVQESIYDALVEKLVAKANALPMGDAAGGQGALGPLINQAQVDRALAIIGDTVAAGASLKAGGTADGLFLAPTVLVDVTPAMRAFKDEMFAPVALLTPFKNDEDAIGLANDTEYGLSAGVISSSVGRAMALGAKLNTGLLHINDQTVADDVVNPFGGRGQSGNGTSIGGPANWDEFSQWQWVTIRGAAPAYPF